MSAHSTAYRRFAHRLREARRLAGLTQADVAIRLKRRQSFVSKVEAGERRVDVIELREFAKLYGKPLSWFLR